MVDSTKLLVLLKDVAYIAELLPAKKASEFALHACKQINGEFISDKGIETEAFAKLLTKLEESEEYLLVLPDSLFVDTMVSVKETSESKIEAELKKSVLADLRLSGETHHLKTITLNEFKGVTRVQLVATPKAPLAVLRVGNDIKKTIKGFCPLSWVVKSIISLEPSISVVQLGEELYVAQHYFGVDQTNSAKIANPEKIVETVKTLKGAEPSIQTTYLLTNSLIEEQLKEALSSVLPLQQVSGKHDSEQLPSHVVTFLQVAAKTLSVKEYQVPVFTLDAASDDETSALSTVFASTSSSADDKEDALPKPAQPKKEKEELIEKTSDEEVVEEKEVEEPKDEIEQIEEVGEVSDATEPTEPEVEVSAESTDEAETEATASTATPAAATPSVISPTIVSPVVEHQTESSAAPSEPEKTPLDKSAEEDIDLSQFAKHAVEVQPAAAQPLATAPAGEKKPIKHSSGIGTMLKMILITTIAFIITISVGVGVGLGILKFASPQEESVAPIVEIEEESPVIDLDEAESATDSSEQTESATELDLSTLKVLVVNATTKAGYAGEIRTKLLAGDFTSVTAGNAKGTYNEPGTYIFLKNGNSSVTAAVTDVTTLTPIVSDEPKAEDAQGQYDVILVLAE